RPKALRDPPPPPRDAPPRLQQPAVQGDPRPDQGRNLLVQSQQLLDRDRTQCPRPQLPLRHRASIPPLPLTVVTDLSQHNCPRLSSPPADGLWNYRSAVPVRDVSIRGSWVDWNGPRSCRRRRSLGSFGVFFPTLRCRRRELKCTDLGAWVRSACFPNRADPASRPRTPGPLGLGFVRRISTLRPPQDITATSCA